jgi:DUF4097 and DUF4098 domain-containing protein YvlB
MKNALFFIPVLIAISVSCDKSFNCIDGNGQVASETRFATEINEIVNTTSVDVAYMKADSTSLRINAESNLFDHIVTVITDGRLEIRTSPRNACFDFKSRPLIMITSPYVRSTDLTASGDFTADTLSGDIVELRSTGSGNIRTNYISCDDLRITLTASGDIGIDSAKANKSDLSLTGSGDIVIAGATDEATMRLTGSGNIRGGDFNAITANETITGSGNITTRVSSVLTAVLTGSGNIYLYGTPTVNQTITGSGRVIRR